MTYWTHIGTETQVLRLRYAREGDKTRCATCEGLVMRTLSPANTLRFLAVLALAVAYLFSLIAYLNGPGNRFTDTISTVLFVLTGAAIFLVFADTTFPRARTQVRAAEPTADGKRSNRWVRMTGMTATILGWHLVGIPVISAFVDWTLGYGASRDDIAIPAPFEKSRMVEWVFGTAILTSVFAVFGMFGILLFAIAARRSLARFEVYVECVWTLTRWGVLVFAVFVCGVVGGWMEYSDALNSMLLWSLVLLFGPAGLVRFVNRPLYPTGHCQKCGYNLTGNSSGVCPECGTAIECVRHVNDAR